MSRFLLLLAATIGPWACTASSAFAEASSSVTVAVPPEITPSQGESNEDGVLLKLLIGDADATQCDYSVVEPGAEIAPPAPLPMSVPPAFVEEASAYDDYSDFDYTYSRGQIGCCRSTCDMVPHYHYYPPMHGHYYFRPYSYRELLQQRFMAPLIGEDPRHPYSNRVFAEVYKAYEQGCIGIPPDRLDEPSPPAVPAVPAPEPGT